MARGDVLIAIKDLNARVQNDTEVWGEILEKHGETVCNERAGSCFSSGMRTTKQYPTPAQESTPIYLGV